MPECARPTLWIASRGTDEAHLLPGSSACTTSQWNTVFFFEIGSWEREDMTWSSEWSKHPQAYVKSTLNFELFQGGPSRFHQAQSPADPVLWSPAARSPLGHSRALWWPEQFPPSFIALHLFWAIPDVPLSSLLPDSFKDSSQVIISEYFHPTSTLGLEFQLLSIQ